QFYTERKDEILEDQKIFRDSLGNLKSKDFFTDNKSYRKRAYFDSQLFINAQKETGAYYRPPAGSKLNSLITPGPNGPGGMALIPMSRQYYDEVVPPELAARELGIGEAQARALVGDKGMARNLFDNRLCNLRQGISAPLADF